LYDVVYFSNVSENTKRFVEKLDLDLNLIRIPVKWDADEPLLVFGDYVLVTPTYGGGEFDVAGPRQVAKFLNIEQNRKLLRGVVGTGNTNFGEHYCLAADVISAKTGAPVLGRVEVFGTPDDVQHVSERLEQLWKVNTVTTN
jgi:protein involved in ribonucleotide reduction